MTNITRRAVGILAGALIAGTLLGGCAATTAEPGQATSSALAMGDSFKPVAGVAYLDPIDAGAPGLDDAVGRLIDEMGKEEALLCAALLRRTDAPSSGERVLLEVWRSGSAQSGVLSRSGSLMSELNSKLVMPFASRLANPYAAFGQSALRVRDRVSLSHLDIKPKRITRGFALARDMQSAKRGLAASGLWKERALSNHMSLLDIQSSQEWDSQSRAVSGSDVVELRRRLAPLSGSPFDERTYLVSRVRGCEEQSGWIAGGLSPASLRTATDSP